MIDDIFEAEELPNFDIYKTAQRVVRDYMSKHAKKIEWVASHLGTTKGYLYASLDPHQTHKPLSADRIIAITKLTEDPRIIEAMAKEVGYTICRPCDIEKVSADTTDVIMKTLDMEAAHGSLAKDVKEAVEDGILDQAEKRSIRDKAYQLRKLAAELEESLK